MEVRIIRSGRKTVGIQVNEDLTVTVRAPRRASKKDLLRILHEKEPWIKRSVDRIRAAKSQRASVRKISEAEIEVLREKARSVIPERVSYFSEILGVGYGRITIRRQKTRWGSCSRNGNLNFNCLLMLAPPEVLDYVVVHELCHRKEMNHSRRFWNEVERILPDYRSSEKWLKNEGALIIRSAAES